MGTIEEIIKIIDNKLIETGKEYLLLGQANQLLVYENIISKAENSEKILKKILEENKIPHAYQTETTPKQWRIPLSEDAKKLLDLKEFENTNKATIPDSKSEIQKVKRNFIIIGIALGLIVFIKVNFFKDIPKPLFDETVSGNEIIRDTVTKNGLIKNYYSLDHSIAETGRICNGKQDSIWCYYNCKGVLIEKGNYKNGIKKGVWKQYNADSILIKETSYVNGKLDGNEITYDEDGKIQLNSSFKNDKLNGLTVEFYKNGKIKSKTNYLDDAKNGNYEKYYENGKIQEKGNFKSGSANGVFQTYIEEGYLSENINYKMGAYDGKYVAYGYNSTLNKHYILETGFYKNGKKDGLFKYFDYYYDFNTKTIYDKLILTRIENYKDGELHGKFIQYDLKYGFKLIETNYISGVEHGYRKNYCPSGEDVGKLYNIQVYKNGEGYGRTYYCDCPSF